MGTPAAGLLRVGDPEALRYYDHHGRIADGDHDTMVEKAYSAWAADEQAGKTSLLLAGDTDTVRALNHRAHTDLVTSGRVTPGGTRLHDGLEAGVGDRVVTRRNDRHLTVGPRWVKNGDTFTVTARHNDGALTAQRPGGGPSVTLPASYVREHVELAYATTAFRAQGATVDTAHAIVTGKGMTREVLYVMLTRAKEANKAYVCTDRRVEPLPGFEDQPTTARSVLTAVMGNVGAAVSAHETAQTEREQAASIRTLAAEYETIAHHAQTPRWTQMLIRAGLTPTQLDQITVSPAFGALSTALRRAEAHGLNLEAALPRLLERVDAGTVDLASVLHQRVDRWTDTSGTSATKGRGSVLGLSLKATAEHPEMVAALQDRVRLMEQRADEFPTAPAPPTHHGSPNSDPNPQTRKTPPTGAPGRAPSSPTANATRSPTPGPPSARQMAGTPNAGARKPSLRA